MPRVLVPIADDSEEIETSCVTDVLVRAGVEARTPPNGQSICHACRRAERDTGRAGGLVEGRAAEGEGRETKGTWLHLLPAHFGLGESTASSR
eukprot:scaffold74600_cov29-Tisochrysis_lutea.AAC.5